MNNKRKYNARVVLWSNDNVSAALTIGKIYNVKDGQIKCDDGELIPQKPATDFLDLKQKTDGCFFIEVIGKIPKSPTPKTNKYYSGKFICISSKPPYLLDEGRIYNVEDGAVKGFRCEDLKNFEQVEKYFNKYLIIEIVDEEKEEKDKERLEISLVATLDEFEQIPAEECMTKYFGDYGMFVKKDTYEGFNEEIFKARYQKALNFLELTEKQALEKNYAGRFDVIKAFQDVACKSCEYYPACKEMGDYRPCRKKGEHPELPCKLYEKRKDKCAECSLGKRECIVGNGQGEPPYISVIRCPFEKEYYKYPDDECNHADEKEAKGDTDE